ncbi:MAG: phosphoglycerate kinase [Gammaproteobacteria bacterium]|nr:MAG: phosphoglycerate kinase [Gammaproteobacteria bacterium]
MRLLKDQDLSNKNVVVRLDLNVPIQDKQIIDSTRIISSVPTIKYLVNKNCKVLLTSHLGRPEEGKFDQDFSMSPVAKKLSEILNHEIDLIDSLDSSDIFNTTQIQLLENLRFLIGEKDNNEKLGNQLANKGDVYIFDAFGTAHRKQASTHSAIQQAKFSCAGLLLEKEINSLNKALTSIENPFTAVIAGSKISTKLELIAHLNSKADFIVVGGGIANTFLKSQGFDVGESLVENDMIEIAKELFNSGKILLPNKVIVADSIDSNSSTTKNIDSVSGSDKIFDINLTSNMSEILKNSKTILWNGPIGVFEKEPFQKGTHQLAKTIAGSEAFSLAGGGETIAAINKFINKDEVSYCSTGGGAFLEYMEGKLLPSIEALGG